MSVLHSPLRVSGDVLVNFKCTWWIPRFSSLDKTPGKYYKSKNFRNEKTSWNIRIYPCGKSSSVKEVVLCTVILNGNSNKGCKFSISLRNVFGDVLSGSGVILQKDLLGKLKDDILVVYVEFTYNKKYLKGSSGCEIVLANCSVQTLTDDFWSLSQNQKTSDTILSVDGSEIPVHHAILGQRSKVFADMFKNDGRGKKCRRVEVTDFEIGTVRSLIEFIYSGSIRSRRMDVNLAMDLLRAGIKYEMNDLKMSVTDFLITQMDKYNVVRLLLFADTNNEKKLRDHAVKYFVKTLTVEDFDRHRSSLKSRPTLLCDIIAALAAKKPKKFDDESYWLTSSSSEKGFSSSEET